MIKILNRSILLGLAVLVLATGCRKRDAVLADNLVNFQTDAQGLTENESSIEIRLTLTRGTDRDIPVAARFAMEGLEYGTDFTTTPAANGNSISLTIPSGNNEVVLKVQTAPGALFD